MYQDLEKETKQLKNEIIRNIKSYNKNANVKELKKKPINRLLPLTHPNDRKKFSNDYQDL